MDINLEYYKIFYYVGKFQSITVAAEKLNISQPAVSQNIKNLEKALGSTLFIRSPKGVKLTAEGEVLFSYVERGYETILSGEKRFKEIQDLESGEILIGASDMTLKFYLLAHLEKFHEAFPNIKVKVTNAPTPETIEHLHNGNIDFGVITTPISSKYKEELELIPVHQVQDAFVANVKYRELKNRTLDLKLLKDFPVVCLEGNTSTRAYVDDFLRRNGVRIEPEFELATSDMLVEFARKGMGIASVVSDFAQEYVDRGELFYLMFNTSIPKRDICIVTDKKIPLSKAATTLLEFMKL